MAPFGLGVTALHYISETTCSRIVGLLLQRPLSHISS